MKDDTKVIEQLALLYPRIKSLCWAITGDENEAENIVREVSARALTKWDGSVATELSFDDWMITLTQDALFTWDRKYPKKTMEAVRSAGEESYRAKPAVLSREPSDPDPVVSLDQMQADAIQRAVEVIGDKAEALRWMGGPVRALNYATPISLLHNLEGCEAVLTVLGRLEHGIP